MPEQADAAQSTGVSRRGAHRWLAILIALALLTCAAMLGATRTEWWNAVLRSQIEQLASDRFAGDLRIERIEGWIFGEIDFMGLELYESGDRVLRVARLAVDWSPLALLRGALLFSRIDVEAPELSLARDAEGDWNLLRALGPREPAPQEGETGPPFPIFIASLQIRDGVAEISDGAAAPVQVTDLTLRASTRLTRRRTVVRFDQADLRAQTAGLPPWGAEFTGRYASSADTQELKIRALSLRSERSRLALSGELELPERLDLALQIDELHPDDLSIWFPGPTLREPVQGTLRTGGPLEAVRFDTKLSSAGAQLRAVGSLDLSSLELARIQAKVSLEGADLEALVANSPLLGVVNASAVVESGEAQLRASLRRGEGKLTAEGSIALSSAPAYQIVATAEHLDPASLVRERPELAGRLDLTARLEGRGSSLRELSGSALLDVRPSTLGQVEITGGTADIQVAAGRLRIEQLDLETRLTKVKLAGQVELKDDGELELTMAGGTEDAGPLLSLLGRKGGGSIEWSGTLAGRRSNAHLVGNARADSLRVEGFEATSGIMQLDIAGIGEAQVAGNAMLQLDGLKTPLGIGNVRAELDALRGEAQSGHLAVHVDGTEGNRSELVLDAMLQPEGVSTALSTLTAVVEGQRWALAGPARIDLEGGALHVQGFKIASSTSRLSAEGKLGGAGEQSLELDLKDVPVSLVAPFLPNAVAPEGRLELEVRLAGTAALPRLNAQLKLRDLALGGRPLEGLDASFRYVDGLGRGELQLHQDASHTLSVDAELPLQLQWASAPSARVLGDLALNAQSRGLDIAFVEGFAASYARGIAGELELDLKVRGPIERPVPEGTLQLRNASFTPNMLGVPLKAVTADASFDAEGIRIRSLRASSGEGRLEAKGDLRLREWVPRTVDASISVQNWPAIATHSYRAQVEGELVAIGDLSALDVKGDLKVLSGTLRPDFAFLTDQPLPRDETIVLAQDPTRVQAPKPPEHVESQVYEGATLALDLEIQRNLWVKHDNASVELAGALRMTKAPHEEVELQGAIESLRGWVELQGRRFRMVEGKVTFTGGGTTDPDLEAIARYKVPNYTIDALLSGTARAPSLELRSNPELEQADILAVLLFGKPAKELGEGEQQSLGRQASELATNFGIKQLSRSVGDALGFTELGIEIEELSQERAAIGAYLNEKTYLTLSQDLGGERFQRFTIEYEFRPGWSILGGSSTSGESSVEGVWKKRY